MLNYYNKDYPVKDDLIVCKVKKHNDSTIELRALEYESTNPYVFILHSEVTKKKRVYSVKSLLKIGEIDVFEVFNVEKTKNTLEVSKKGVTIEEKNNKMNDYLAETKAINVLRYFIKLFDLDIDYVKDKINIYETPLKLIKAIRDDDNVLDVLDDEQKARVKELIDHHYAEKEVLIRTDFELTYFGPEGIDGIKQAIKSGQVLETPEIPLSIRYLSAPKYTIQSNVVKSKKDEAESLHELVCETIENTLKTLRGPSSFKSLGFIEHSNIVEKGDNDSLDDDSDSNGDEEEESDGESGDEVMEDKRRYKDIY